MDITLSTCESLYLFLTVEGLLLVMCSCCSNSYVDGRLKVSPVGSEGGRVKVYSFSEGSGSTYAYVVQVYICKVENEVTVHC